MNRVLRAIGFAARKYKIAFLETATSDSVAQVIDEGVRTIAGRRAEAARIGRGHFNRTMPV